MSASEFLVEIGTEELPPKALRTLMDGFAENLAATLDTARLDHGAVHAYASPRRLAVLIDSLAAGQADRNVAQKGPPVTVAFDGDGKPLPAALAFAKKCGVDVVDLQRTVTDDGEWLSFELTEKGLSTAELMPGLVEQALAALPIPRRMRWGAGDAEFVRPVHWVVLLHGKNAIAGAVLGIAAGRESRGHRFHSGAAVNIPAANKYLQTLEKKGHVIADFERRRALVEEGAAAKAKEAGGYVVNGEALYDEVAALVEWPVPVLGRFDEQYLALPREVVISTLTSHQRYFPVADASGDLLARFITIANLESTDPDQVRDGNERVIRPRLADAAFFWDSDRGTTLAQRATALHDVVYQRGLGSLLDKTTRVGALAAFLAETVAADPTSVERAARLCKCDLLTGMVGEFPELQGTMGRYYAVADGEADAVADAIGEHYQPRYAGDALPASVDGQLLALADKLDTLAGVFSLGKKPSGKRDPFGLRRAALGIVRILVECGIDIDLGAAIDTAVAAQPQGKLDADDVSNDVSTFISDRLRRYFLDRDAALASETFDAVLARDPASLVDFDRRLAAVQAFVALPEAAGLAAANKRIANILKKADYDAAAAASRTLLQDPAELALFAALGEAGKTVQPLMAERRYTEALSALAALRGPVDNFFDEVMVMADDDRIKRNRLALLGELRDLFLDVADISKLSVA